MGSVLLRPTSVTSGGAILVGGSGCLGDTSDSTYMQVPNLDTVFPAPVVSFHGAVLPLSPTDLVTITMWARYAQTAGTTAGRPSIAWTVNTALRLENETFASFTGTSDTASPIATGVIDEVSPFSQMIDVGFLTSPRDWYLSFSHDHYGVCDFRLYEVGIQITYPDPPVGGWAVNSLAMQ